MRAWKINIALFFIILQLLVAFGQPAPSLKLAAIIFRHGDRTAIHMLPNDKNAEETWPEGLGQLTMTGVTQQFMNGQYFRQKYDGFIDKTYHHNQIHVRSTDVDRTLMSAQAMLAGLYHPPQTEQLWKSDLPWMPIPVHTEPKSQDFVYKASDTYEGEDRKHYCPMDGDLDFLKTPEAKAFLLKHQETFDYMRNNSLVNISAGGVLDTLICEKFHGKTWPEWATEDLYNKLNFEIIPQVQGFLLKKSDVGNHNHGVVVYQIADLFKMKLNNTLDPDVRVFFFSGHDTTILAVLGSLDLYESNKQVVPYCATIMFELHHEDVKGWFVRMYYKNTTDWKTDSNAQSQQLHQFTIPGCLADCPLSKFFNITSFYSQENYVKKCLAPRVFRVESCGKQKTTSEYLVGDRKLPMVPVAMSICVSLISSNTVLGVPAEVYNYGITYVWYALAAFAATVFSGLFFVPLFYPLALTSIYEYLEMRYGSKAVRLFAVIILLFHQFMYVGTVIYGPATALSVATGIDDWVMILICACVGTIYTAVGGIKGVVYTDVFQCLIMIIGQLVVIGVGIHKVGGASEVWELNEQWGRLKTDTDGDVTARASVYSTVIGGFFLGIAVFGTYQPAVQRALGCRNQTQATLSYIVAAPIVFLAYFISMSVGWVIFAFYAKEKCDPLVAGDIANVNQLLPRFIVNVVDYPGIPGLFFAAVVCGSLSSLSSSLNAVSAVIWDDCLKSCFPNWSEVKKSSLLKVIAILFGLICLGAAYMFLYVGGTLISIALSIFGAVQGPIMAVVFLAAIIPFSNWIGALVGGVIALTITLWMMIGRVELGRKFQRLPVPSECDVISDVMNSTTAMAANVTTTGAPLPPEDLSDLEWFYAVSLYYYSVIALIIVLLIGTLVSLVTGCTKPSEVPKKYLAPGVRNCAGSKEE